MKLKLDELPPDLQPLARLINRLHAMNTLVRHRAAKDRMSQIQQAILADLDPMQSVSPVLSKTYAAIKDKPVDVIGWMKHANNLRELLRMSLKDKEAAGEWCASEVDLREHQADDKPIG